MMTQFGNVVGIQIMQATQAAREDAVGALDAYGEAYLVGAGAALLGLAFAFFVRSSTVRRPRAGRPLVSPRRMRRIPQA